MRKIFNFNQFINENYKINEGGGAGIDFKTKADLKAVYELSASGIERKSLDVSMDDVFSATGYDDGMSDLGTWMLKASAEDPKESTVMQIPIGSVQDVDKFFDDIDLPEGEREKIEKIGDLFVALPELVLNLNLDLSYRDYREMHFRGYVRGTFKKGDIVIGGSDTKYDNGDYDTITLSYGSGNVDTYEIYIDQKSGDVLDEVKPQLAATDTFVEFYKNVFLNAYENFDAFIKSELIDNDLEEGLVDDEVLEYIENNDMNISVEEFKKDAKKYVTDDFVDFMKGKDDYHTNKWDSYYNMLQEDYGKDNPGGREQEEQ